MRDDFISKIGVYGQMHSLSEVEAFSYGFRFGVKLMIEAVDPK